MEINAEREKCDNSHVPRSAALTLTICALRLSRIKPTRYGGLIRVSHTRGLGGGARPFDIVGMPVAETDYALTVPIRQNPTAGIVRHPSFGAVVTESKQIK